MTCSVEGCERKVHCRGWCAMHYKRWERHGTPDAPRRVPRRGSAHPKWKQTEARRLVASGVSASETGRRLGVPASTVTYWLRQPAAAPTTLTCHICGEPTRTHPIVDNPCRPLVAV